MKRKVYTAPHCATVSIAQKDGVLETLVPFSDVDASDSTKVKREVFFSDDDASAGSLWGE